MIGDRDVWAAALRIIRRYGDDAMLEAAERADQLLEEGDMAGAETWHRILSAIERLQATKPVEGEGCALTPQPTWTPDIFSLADAVTPAVTRRLIDVGF